MGNNKNKISMNIRMTLLNKILIFKLLNNVQINMIMIKMNQKIYFQIKKRIKCWILKNIEMILFMEKILICSIRNHKIQILKILKMQLILSKISMKTIKKFIKIFKHIKKKKISKNEFLFFKEGILISQNKNFSKIDVFKIAKFFDIFLIE